MTSSLKQKTVFDLFPTPEFLLLSTVGIVMTDADTKLVQLRRKIFGNGFKLARSSKTNNPKGAIKSGMIANPDQITPILKKLASQYNIHYAHAILPEEKAYLFTTTIGRVPPEGLKDAVAFIIEENAPVSLTESVFDFEILDENENTNDIKLTVSVLPKGVVSAYEQLFESAGIIPISFDLESQAIARAVIRRGDRRPHLIINLSLEKTGFYVVEREVVQFSTTYSVGAGGSYLNPNDLKAEMHKVLAFWHAHTDKAGKSENQIAQIILCGVVGNDKDFFERFLGDSDIPCALADVWLNMSPSHSHTSKMSFGESLDYASAIGLLLPHNR